MGDTAEASYTKAVARNMLRDLVPCADFDEISRQLGFVPASDEVEYAEHVASHVRKGAVEPLIGMIGQLATGAAQVIAGVQSASLGPLVPEQVAVYEAVARGAAFVVLAQLLEFGYLGVAV